MKFFFWGHPLLVMLLGFLVGYVGFLVGLLWDLCLSGPVLSSMAAFRGRSLMSISQSTLLLSTLSVIIIAVSYQKFSFGKELGPRTSLPIIRTRS